MKLVVVESPAKAKTIEKYLGSGHRVLASFGHVRDLPPKDGSVDPEQGFDMLWQVSPDRSKQLKAITDEAKKADTLILATDPDREGEAISWHVQEVLRQKKALPKDVQRVTFNAITKSAVTEAMKKPRGLDEDLIDAYRARRALDYLVGFTLSPILWRKLPGAKSAGRVQSVALRLIVDREREIELFKPQEYWQVSASFEADGQTFTARLAQFDGKKIDRLTIGNRGDADAAKAAVEAGRFAVSSVETKPFSRNPPPPFTTSTLQQEAARKLGFSASHTMRVAQGLYEDGLITYMRTDGVDMAPEAVSAARKAIASRYDAGFVPDKPRQYQSKIKNAQEAHEAIRPTDFDRSRAASADHARLYELVYNRALASQMASARLERTTVELNDGTGRTLLRASGQVVLFPGFLALYEEGRDEKADEEDGARMPLLRAGDAPVKTGVEATQHFTQPPPRYSEASLVKRLEELGIGRPSTYAATLQTLKDREYVRTDKGRFVPEESGRLVTAFLERFFERYVSYDYTAELEEELDDVSGGGSSGRSCSTTSGATSSPRPARSWIRSRAKSPRRSTSFSLPGSTRRAPMAATRASVRNAEMAGSTYAAASSARSSPARIIPTAATRRSSARAATRRKAKVRPISATESCSRAAVSGPMSSAARNVPRFPRTCRWKTSLPRLRSGCFHCLARSAPTPNPASRLRPRSGVTAPISPMTVNMRSLARLPKCSKRA